MKYRKMDENGEYIFGHGKYDFLLNSEAVAQAIKTKILLLKREWWEDVLIGTPLFNGMLSSRMSNEQKTAIDLILRDRIMEVENVETIIEFKSEFDNVKRAYSMRCKVETSFGDTTVKMVFE